MTPSEKALQEAARAETARIYSSTLRESRATDKRAIAEWTNTAEQVAERRRVAESLNVRHLRSVS